MPVYQQYPKRVTIWPHTDIVVAGNAIAGATPSGTAAAKFSYWYQSAPAINDHRTNSFVIAGGTYTFRVRYVRSNAAGIGTVYIDGSSIGTYDAYNATIDEAVSTIGSVVLTPGYHKLEIKALSKNASSSNYNLFNEVYDFYPSSD